MVQHFLNFVSSGHGERQIDEPFGFSSAEFTLEQNDYYGRDVQLAAGKNRLSFYEYPNHYLELILLNKRKFGYESVIQYYIKIDGVEQYRAEIDFLEHTSDDKTYFECTLVDLGVSATMRNRSEVKTNIMGGKGVDGNDTDIPELYTALFPAKPVVGVSQWETPETSNQVVSLVGLGGEGASIIKSFNFANAQIKYGIPDSLSYLQGVQPTRFFGYVEFANNGKDIKIEITNVNLTVDGTGNGYGNTLLYWYIGEDEDLEGGGYGVGNALHAIEITDNETKSIVDGSYTINVPTVKRGQKLYIWFVAYAQVATNLDTFGLVNTLNSMDVKITATSIAYNTVVPFIRLIDAVRAVITNISGLQVYSPRLDVGGELYNQFVTTSSLMRRLFDKPVNSTWKDIISGWLNEFNCGYTITSDNIVFIGFYRDFYKNVSLGVFNQATTKDYNRKFNDRYKNNQFRYKYSSYASLKENEQDNTYDIVHGESEDVNGNKKTANIKEVDVKYIRDAFLLEKMRSDAYNLKDDTATQDDDKFGVVELVTLTDTDRQYVETSDLRHTANEDGTLTLTNNSSFSWIQLGLKVLDTFQILEGANQGTYTIIVFDDFKIVLSPNNNNTPESVVSDSTTYLYVIGDQYTLKVRTYEGFDYINNISEPRNYANLDKTIKRNKINYYSDYLATMALYSNNKPYKNTLYKNNPKAETKLIGEEIVVEGADYTPTGALLDSFQDSVFLEMSYEEALTVMKRSRDENGWIGFYDNSGLLQKTYLRSMTWNMESVDNEGGYWGISKIQGELKYDMFLLEIFVAEDKTLLINGGASGANTFDYTIDEYEKLSIFDEVGKLLYPPVPYNRVRVNNSGQATSTVELMQWLNNIK